MTVEIEIVESSESSHMTTLVTSIMAVMSSLIMMEYAVAPLLRRLPISDPQAMSHAILMLTVSSWTIWKVFDVEINPFTFFVMCASRHRTLPPEGYSEFWMHYAVYLLGAVIGLCISIGHASRRR